MKASVEDYRKGAMGAILDEYERALQEIIELITPISQNNFTTIMDERTQDPDCRSMQTIMEHVINAGYGYCFYIRKRNNQDVERIRTEINGVEHVQDEGKKMFDYVVDTADSLDFDLSDGKSWQEFVFRAPWGEIYNLEQILEHAIVHILRHRRQIEKFILQQSTE